MKPSGIGGMAVMEGVMMKNKDEYAVAVRKPDNEIVVEKSTYRDFSDKVKLFKLPIFRGMLAFVDSMVIGVKVLNFSASFFEDEEETEKEKAKKKNSKKNKNTDADIEIVDLTSDNTDNTTVKKKLPVEKTAEEKAKDEKSNALLMLFAVLLSIVLSVSLFMVLPVLVTNLFSKIVTSRLLLNLIEGILRLVIFIGYVILAAKMPEIKRVFMYHGAEHKTINCLENGFELTVENVRWQSKQHKRCGTSFMLLVILISLIFFILLPTTNLFWRVISRIVLVPFIAGVSYEFIRLAGRSESRIVDVLSRPGLWMQGLTTKEPDDSMIEVAIQSVGAVFDWRAFLETSATADKTTKATGAKKEQTSKETATVQSSSTGKKPVVAKPAHNEKPSASAVKTTGASGKDGAGKQTSEAMPKAADSGSAPAGTVKHGSHQDMGRSHTNNTPSIAFKPTVTNRPEDEDDEILKALDKFFDEGSKEGKAGEK